MSVYSLLIAFFSYWKGITSQSLTTKISNLDILIENKPASLNAQNLNGKMGIIFYLSFIQTTVHLGVATRITPTYSIVALNIHVKYFG